MSRCHVPSCPADSASRKQFKRCLQGFLFLPWLLWPGLCASNVSGQQPAAAEAEIATLKSEIEQTSQRVRQIVNQPVTHLARQPGMRVQVLSPGWFHEGASRPNFNIVDVRTTQDLNYAKFGYVTSDLNPGVVFVGQQLEFNPMTKYFYTDRSVPKKKLSEAEMLEINRLYRILGSCEHKLAQLALQADLRENERAQAMESTADPDPVPGTSATSRLARIPRTNFMYGGLAVLSVLVLYGIYRKLAR